MRISLGGRNGPRRIGESNTKYEAREMTVVELDQTDLEAVTGGGNAGLAARDTVAKWFDNYIDRQYQMIHAEYLYMKDHL